MSKKKNRSFKDMKEQVEKIMIEHERIRPYKLLILANLSSQSKREVCDALLKEGFMKQVKIDKHHYEYVLRGR